MQEFRVPRLALGEDERMVLLEWLIELGDGFSEGQVILEVETDKATMEVEAPFDGVLAKVVCDPGTEVEAGTLIAWVADPDEDYDPGELPAREPSTRGLSEDEETGAQSVEPELASRPQPMAATQAPRRGANDASVSHGELRGLPSGGSRPGSSTRAAPRRELDPEAAGPFSAVALSRHRSAVARSSSSSNAVPQFSVLRDVAVGAAVHALRALREVSPAATLSDIVLLAVARALASAPALNAWFDGQTAYRFEHANIALAVDGPDGVIAPVIRSVDKLTAAELVAERTRVVSGARDGRLSGRDLLGGTFTVSNIGPLGADALVPMLTPPQVAILAVGRGRGEDEQAVMTMTLVGDHRAIDGADGARFLAALDQQLEASSTTLVPDLAGDGSDART